MQIKKMIKVYFMLKFRHVYARKIYIGSLFNVSVDDRHIGLFTPIPIANSKHFKHT